MLKSDQQMRCEETWQFGGSSEQRTTDGNQVTLQILLNLTDKFARRSHMWMARNAQKQ
jgi:hypothetical protein